MLRRSSRIPSGLNQRGISRRSPDATPARQPVLNPVFCQEQDEVEEKQRRRVTQRGLCKLALLFTARNRPNFKRTQEAYADKEFAFPHPTLAGEYDAEEPKNDYMQY